MGRTVEPIVIYDRGRALLQTWARARSQPLRVIQRAQIILLAAEGVESRTIARRAGPRVFVWSASVKRSLTKVAECKDALDTLH